MNYFTSQLLYYNYITIAAINPEVILTSVSDFRSLEKFASLEEEDDFTEVVISPKIVPKSEQSVSPTVPEFKLVKVSDIFNKLVSLYFNTVPEFKRLNVSDIFNKLESLYY